MGIQINFFALLAVIVIALVILAVIGVGIFLFLRYLSKSSD